MHFLIEQASTYAKDIDEVIAVIFFFTFFWLLVAEFLLFYFIYKYRRKAGQKAAYIEGESHDETKWIHWPHYAVILCDIVIIFFAVRVWYNVKQTLPTADATVRIIGQQWAWTFIHPGQDGQIDTSDDIALVDELHIQVGKTYHYKLEAKDVLHSFSVPVFRLKQDAVPGRVITGWFEPTKVGQYDIQCAEMCGIGHGIMGAATLYVETPEQHVQWINENTPGADIQVTER